MKILGKVKAVLPLQSGTSQRGPWSRATVVIEYKSGNYFNTLALDNMSNAEEFSKLAVGEFYTFYFEPSSREYQGRYDTQCTCFNWVPYAAQAQAPAPAPAPGRAPSPAVPSAAPEDMPSAW